MTASVPSDTTNVDDMRTAYAEYIMDTHTTMYSPISPNKSSQEKSPNKKTPQPINIVYKLSDFL